MNKLSMFIMIPVIFMILGAFVFYLLSHDGEDSTSLNPIEDNQSIEQDRIIDSQPAGGDSRKSILNTSDNKDRPGNANPGDPTSPEFWNNLPDGTIIKTARDFFTKLNESNKKEITKPLVWKIFTKIKKIGSREAISFLLECMELQDDTFDFSHRASTFMDLLWDIPTEYRELVADSAVRKIKQVMNYEDLNWYRFDGYSQLAGRHGNRNHIDYLISLMNEDIEVSKNNPGIAGGKNTQIVDSCFKAIVCTNGDPGAAEYLLMNPKGNAFIFMRSNKIKDILKANPTKTIEIAKELVLTKGIYPEHNRRQIADAFGSSGNVDAFNVLTTLFNDADPSRRILAVSGLRGVKKDNSSPEIIEMAREMYLRATRDPDEKVREEAKEIAKDNKLYS